MLSSIGTCVHMLTHVLDSLLLFVCAYMRGCTHAHTHICVIYVCVCATYVRVSTHARACVFVCVGMCERECDMGARRQRAHGGAAAKVRLAAVRPVLTSLPSPLGVSNKTYADDYP